VDRIIDVFPMHQQQQVRMQLSVNLLGVLSQTLIRRKDGRGRIAAFEVMVCTGAVRNMIRENKSYQISSLIQTGSRVKMQSLDQSLAELVEKGLVTIEEAKSRAKDPWEFERMIQLDKDASDAAAAAALKAGTVAVPKFTGSHAQQQHLTNDPLADADAKAEEEPVTAPPSGPIRGQPNRPGYKKE
jgi:twitching motility protein PilT